MSKTPLLDALETGTWPSFVQDILANTEDIPADISRAVDKHFWELAEGDSDGCTCQSCGRKYRVDLLIPDDLWERIKPAGKPEGAGLLCGLCIMARVEAMGGFGALHASAEIAKTAGLLRAMQESA